ncbi:tRNA-splicing endonuclease subunit Sen15 isoform X2 [Pseudophryne corroboree]|uniref:tRNA-splicing endonuclease subunit Sen15 isoform X2 n=1 Tax=Pseudophryne corroboree TaxID=495146 RepID=UPI003081733E
MSHVTWGRFSVCTSRDPVVMDTAMELGAAVAGAEMSSGTRGEEEPWILEHPKFKEMMTLDVAESAQVYAAFLVYMDLLEVRNWHKVQILGSDELHLVYLLGQEKGDNVPQVIIPTPVTMSCSHERIQQFLNLSHTSEEDLSTSKDCLLGYLP